MKEGLPIAAPTLDDLKTWLEQQARLADKSSHEWKLGNVREQDAYWSGQWFAYHNVLNFLTGANYV